MRRFWINAFLAVPFFSFAATTTGYANSDTSTSHGFGCFDIAFRIFPHIHQHGPLFNYGPYYGYYPFTPYGPWDPYLRYNPYFYGDPYANFGNKQNPPPRYPQEDHPGRYGCNPKLQGHGHPGFWHASWLHGGWFRGHTWLAGGSPFHKPACTSCGGVAVAQPTTPTGDVIARYTGFGTPAQSAVYYPATPTLDPALELIQTAGQSR